MNFAMDEWLGQQGKYTNSCLHCLYLAGALADGENKSTVLVWGSDKEPAEGTRLKLGWCKGWTKMKCFDWCLEMSQD
jgi:hypothetical protein